MLTMLVEIVRSLEENAILDLIPFKYEHHNKTRALKLNFSQDRTSTSQVRGQFSPVAPLESAEGVLRQVSWDAKLSKNVIC